MEEEGWREDATKSSSSTENGTAPVPVIAPGFMNRYQSKSNTNIEY